MIVDNNKEDLCEKEKKIVEKKREKMGLVVLFINLLYDFGNFVVDNWEINMMKRFDRVILMVFLCIRFLDIEKMCLWIFWYFIEMWCNIDKLMCK